MQAGKLDTLLTLEEPSETVVSGDATVRFTERGTAWANVEWLGGSVRGATVGAQYRITTRFRGDLTIAPRWRLGIKGTARKFDVAAVGDPDGRRRELVILANEVLLPAKVSG